MLKKNFFITIQNEFHKSHQRLNDQHLGDVHIHLQQLVEHHLVVLAVDERYAAPLDV